MFSTYIYGIIFLGDVMAVGIICEYNPFHNGHIYHINKTKELFPNEPIVLVLNGYFLERGEISVLDKENKVKLALKYGVNLVVELPFYYGIHSADNFAYGAINILNELKVDKIVFGSESNDINLLKKYIDEDSLLIKSNLKKGQSYAKALNKIKQPNDILGICYLKAINKINPDILAYPIKRTNSYHDLGSNSSIISASNIRNKLINNENIDDYVPDTSNIKNIDNEIIFDFLKYKIISDDNLDSYLLVTEGLHNKLKKVIEFSNSFVDLVNNLKSKRYTTTRIQRMLICILIGYKKEYYSGELDYLKILGFDSIGQQYLSTVDLSKLLNNKASIIYQLELKSSKIYSLITNSNTIDFDLKNKPIKNH